MQRLNEIKKPVFDDKGPRTRLTCFFSLHSSQVMVTIVTEIHSFHLLSIAFVESYQNVKSI